MINIKEYINNLNVEIGATRRSNCPICNGYKTFTVTNNMGTVLWNCYKASCDLSGSSRVHLSVQDIKDVFDKSNKEHKEKPFELPEYVVRRSDAPHVLVWCTKWGICPDKSDIRYDIREDRIVFPITSNGKIVDAIGRSLKNKLPKWKKYGNSGLPFSSGCGKVAVVVEDCVSAVAIGSDVYVGVAVLGTSLSEIHKKYLSQFSTAIIALDPDALPKTLQFAKELRGHVQDIRVLRLQDDLKYFKKEDYNNLV